MSSEPPAPHLVATVGRWVEGWALCRTSSPWTYDGSAWVVDVMGSAHRSRETFLVSPDDAELARHTAELAGRARTWLTVFTPEPVVPPAPPGTDIPLTGELLMTTRLSAPGVPRVPVSLAVELSARGGRALASVVLDGERAAEGTVGVVDDTAVFDRIRTFDAFRRRGLGTDVMAALTAWALERGATSGVLAASVEGQALYARLGWTGSGSLVTLVGVAPPA